MLIQNRYIDFFTLREAYLEVKGFIETETYEKVHSLKLKLVENLGVAGDDNFDLLEKFVTKYKLDTKGFYYQEHFHTEYELFGSEQAFYNLIKVLMYALLTFLNILTFGKVKVNLIKLNMLDVQRQVTDMTVGDMVTWYLEKEYKTRQGIKYMLKNNT